MTTATGGPSLAGQSSVGQRVSSPWFDGSFEITQGWGPSIYPGEPEGHGYKHWHAGGDIGMPCGTLIKLPVGLHATVVYLDNPGGYGTGMIVQIWDPTPDAGGAPVIVQKRRIDIYLGHLRQRLAPSGVVTGGAHLAISNNTGNSTGCHLHFEARPPGAKYGTDVDPTSWLESPGGSSTTGAAAPTTDQNPYNNLDPRHEIWNLEHAVTTGIVAFENELMGLAQAGLGSVMLLGGLVTVGLGLRGQNVAGVGQTVRETVGRAQDARSKQLFQGEKQTQGMIARDVGEQARESAQEQAGIRRNTTGAYRAGLVSQAEAQRRLGLPVRRVGAGSHVKGPPRGYGRTRTGITDPSGIAKDRAATISRNMARNSRLRPSHQPKFEVASEPPF